MHQGQVLMEGSPEAVRTDERVIEAYLGGEV
jgi:branched-chain amino acid transport system ATP-binding protein